VQPDGDGQVLVPVEAPSQQDDGSYALRFGPAELEAWDGTGSNVSGRLFVVRVMVEALEIEKPQVETGRVGVSKVAHEREEVIRQTAAAPRRGEH
jgi:hypothetical protein